MKRAYVSALLETRLRLKTERNFLPLNRTAHFLRTRCKADIVPMTMASRDFKRVASVQRTTACQLLPDTRPSRNFSFTREDRAAFESQKADDGACQQSGVD